MMNMANYMRAAVAALTLASAGMAAAAQDARSDTASASAYDSGANTASAKAAPVRSVEDADSRLAAAARERAAAEARFAASERDCYTRFLVNRCLDKAREKRRAALASLRAIEVEAGHFKRAAAVARRDAELAEKQRQDEQEAAARAAAPPRKP
jgi:colicin import membrane protein